MGLISISSLEIFADILAFIAIQYMTLAVWLRNPKSWTNRLFFILGETLAVYVVFNYLSLHPLGVTPESQLFWIRMVMFLASIKAPILFLLSYNFPGEKFILPKIYLAIVLVLMAGAGAASLAPLVFSGIEYVAGEPIPIAGPGMALFLLNFGGSVVLSFVILIRKCLLATGVERAKIYDFLVGIIITFVLIIVATLIPIIIFKNSYAIFLGPLFPLILTAAVAHAIVEYKFLDVQPIIARAVSYIFLMVVLATLYSAGLFLGTTYLIGEAFDWKRLILNIVLLSAAALFFQPLQKFIRKVTDRFLFKGLYDVDVLLGTLVRAMTQTIELEKLAKSILGILIREMRLTKAAFLIIDNHKIADFKGIGYELDGFVGSPLEALLHGENDGLPKSLVFENLKDDRTRDLFRQYDIAVAIPIRSSHQEEVALLVLGSKLAGDLYSQKDLFLLELFASESGIVIQNAHLYEHLKLAVEAKSQFISVVSHQMRTPVSAIRWSLELLQQKALATEKRTEFLASAYHNAIFLSEQLDDVFTALSIQDKGLVLQKELTDFNSVLRELPNIFEHEIKDKKLNVSFDLSAAVTPVFCDAARIKKVFKVFFRNAITYTPTGGAVSVKLFPAQLAGKKAAAVSFADTGIGLTVEEKPKIFDRFFRGEKARLMLPDGMGLGMFIAKTFVEAHNGSIAVESGGRDRGSNFTVILPLQV